MMLDTDYDACKWGSHLPALIGCVAASRGTVVEIGVGHFSTPALHAICGGLGRVLHSVEKDQVWMVKFRDIFESSIHHFGSTVFNSAPIGVAFIDDSPGGANRAMHFKDFIKTSQFVVVHDYHHDNEEHIGPLLKGLQFHVCKLYDPPTLVASRFDIPTSIKCL